MRILSVVYPENTYPLLLRNSSAISPNLAFMVRLSDDPNVPANYLTNADGIRRYCIERIGVSFHGFMIFALFLLNVVDMGAALLAA